jgi:hypothetical protein
VLGICAAPTATLIRREASKGIAASLTAIRHTWILERIDASRPPCSNAPCQTLAICLRQTWVHHSGRSICRLAHRVPQTSNFAAETDKNSTAPLSYAGRWDVANVTLHSCEWIF